MVICAYWVHCTQVFGQLSHFITNNCGKIDLCYAKSESTYYIIGYWVTFILVNICTYWLNCTQVFSRFSHLIHKNFDKIALDNQRLLQNRWILCKNLSLVIRYKSRLYDEVHFGGNLCILGTLHSGFWPIIALDNQRMLQNRWILCEILV